mgnify:CR=1 FL=1
MIVARSSENLVHRTGVIPSQSTLRDIHNTQSTLGPRNTVLAIKGASKSISEIFYFPNYLKVIGKAYKMTYKFLVREAITLPFQSKKNIESKSASKKDIQIENNK